MLTLAFYKGGKTLFDKITKLRTNGEHTHVELLFSDGMSFSSSQWDGGTRFKRIEYDPSKWDLVPVEGIDEGLVRRWCEKQVGKKYDWRAILGLMAGKSNPGDADKLFCSEACLAALQPGRYTGLEMRVLAYEHLGTGLFYHLNPSETSPQLLWAVSEARREAREGASVQSNPFGFKKAA